MQYSDHHTGHVKTGPTLRNPDLPYPMFTPCPDPLSSSPLVSFQRNHSTWTTTSASCTSCKNCFIQTISSEGTVGGAQTHQKNLFYQKCFADIENCTVRLVLPVLPLNAVKICPCISFHSRDVALNWLQHP